MRIFPWLMTSSILLSAYGADQPQWGQRDSRNMVSLEKGLPHTFDPQSGLNVKWSASLGTETHSTPVLANGKVFIGTNNNDPKDPKHKGDRGVLMCFDEKTGQFLWQMVVPKLDEDPYYDWPNTGMSSPVTVEGNRAYTTSNRGEVICLDVDGFRNGNDGPFVDEARHMAPATQAPIEPGATDADIIWLLDMPKEVGIWPHDGAHSSILIDGDFLYVNTATGVDNTHRKIRTPDAPGLIVVDKKSGKLVARDREGTAVNTFHATWSSPSKGMIHGKPVIFFAGGNGIVYAFEPIAKAAKSGEVQTLKKVWQYDFDPAAPKTEVHRFTSNRKESPSVIHSMPVFVDGKLYLSGGGDLWWGKNEAWLKCVDPEKGNDASAEVWVYPLQKHVMSSAAVYGDLVFIADCGRSFHCLDRKTGKALWTQDIQGEVWASPMVADGKVYLGTRSGQFWVFEASTQKKVLTSLELKTPISGTVTPANGVVFLATMNKLFALSNPSGVR